MYENKVMLGFIRVHILYHASEPEGVYGMGMMHELESHGYSMSPGTLYPIFHEMERDGLITARRVKVGGRVRKVYHATPEGLEVLDRLKVFVEELFHEVAWNGPDGAPVGNDGDVSA